MTTATLTPYRSQPTSQIGPRLFRKQLLPKGSIDYKGRKVTFDEPYLRQLVDSFNQAAYDQVTFQLADADNRHTLDPERTRGTVRGLELADDGVDALIELTDEGAKVVQDNPVLGVSARIVEGLQRADGHTFPAAVQHVLGTTDPRVTGMRPWQAVDLATPVTETVDLTAATYIEGKPTMTTTADQNAATLTAEEVKRFRAFLDSENTLVKPPKPSQDDIDAALATATADGNTASPELSEDAQAAIELATARADQALADQRALREQLAKERAATEAAEYVRAGVPPAIVDCARPVLEQPEPAVLELANQPDIDATDTIRRMLNLAKGLVDLSAERGHQNGDTAAADRAELDAMHAAADAIYGKPAGAIPGRR